MVPVYAPEQLLRQAHFQPWALKVSGAGPRPDSTGLPGLWPLPVYCAYYPS